MRTGPCGSGRAAGRKRHGRRRRMQSTRGRRFIGTNRGRQLATLFCHVLKPRSLFCVNVACIRRALRVRARDRADQCDELALERAHGGTRIGTGGTRPSGSGFAVSVCHLRRPMSD